MLSKIINAYNSSKNRIFLLDYDGTLVGFKDDPAHALPDHELFDILEVLCSQKSNTVFFITGRGMDFLDNNFGKLSINFVAEHGGWLKTIGNDWQKILDLDNSWIEHLSIIMNRYVQKTPGTFMETKGFSIVWHYRGANKQIIGQRLTEIKKELQNAIINKPLIIAEGFGMLEVRNQEINKNIGAKKALSFGNYDFILSAGDDLTDEDMFKAIPETGYSIKIGDQNTCAQYSIPNYILFREFLKKF
jgi:trehalose 6-phosphate synthase/phosphatase